MRLDLGLFEIFMPILWPALPYFIRYRITLLIERLRTRASIEIPRNKVEVFYVNRETGGLFSNATKINSEILKENFPRFSLVISCKGEKETIREFLDSLTIQSLPPSELIICDAGRGLEIKKIVDDWAKKNKQISVIFFQSEGANIAFARNRGVERASFEIIAFADLGTRLDSNWARNLIAPFLISEVDCSMGWYRGLGDQTWQVEMKKFILAKLENLDVSTFLPSTRSLAIKKAVFLKCGGFLETLSLAAEDSLFGFKMKKENIKLAFSPDAIVDWQLPNNIFSMWKKLYRYARGDAETGFLFWQHYLNLLTEAAKGSFDLFVVIILTLIFDLFTSSSIILIILIGLFPLRRMVMYFMRFGKLGPHPYSRLLVLFVLSSAQLFGFIKGLFNLRHDRELLSLATDAGSEYAG